MSVTLRYSGALQDKARLESLVEDFRDIAATHAWPVDALEAASQEAAAKRGRGARTLARPLSLQGLKIYVHPQTDPLWLTFDAGDAGDVHGAAGLVARVLRGRHGQDRAFVYPDVGVVVVGVCSQTARLARALEPG